MSRPRLLALAVLGALLTLVPATAQALQPNGRNLRPAGRLTALGNFPTGSALTPDGRFLWVVDSGHGRDDVEILDVPSGRVIQTLPLPGGFLGVALSPDGLHAYVAGSAKGSSTPTGPVKGENGDVIHVFDVDPASGSAVERDPIAMPQSADGQGQRNSLPPTSKVYPEGVAVSADGRTLAVALLQADKLAIVDLESRAVSTVSVGAYPGRVVTDPRARVAYVANEYDGTVSAVDLDAKNVRTTYAVGGPLGDRNAHPEGMAVDRDGAHLYVAVANRDFIADIDLRHDRVAGMYSVARPQAPGTEPTDVELSADERTLYAVDSGEDAIAVIALAERPATPEPVVMARDGKTPAKPHVVRRHRTVGSIQRYRIRHAQELRRLRRALHRAGKSRRARTAARDRYGRTELALRRRWLIGIPRTACDGPTDAEDAAWQRSVLRALHRYGAVSGRRSDRGTRAFRRTVATAKRRLPKFRDCSSAQLGDIPGTQRGELLGRIPTAAYPTSVQATPDGSRLVWVAGKGLGTGPNPQYSFYGKSPYGAYVLDALIGQAGVLTQPTDLQSRALTAAADAQVAPAASTQPRPEGSPVGRQDGTPSDKIKHIFYFVRENRTYDQIFGSDPRGEGDPKLELFEDNGVAGPTGGVTPNAHKLVKTFPLLDHVFADSEVSVDGHTITSGAYAIDYEQKGVPQNYSDRGKAYDFGLYPVTFPPRDFIFDQAARQGVSFRSWGEIAAGNLPTGNDGRPTYPTVVANTDDTYPNEALIGCAAQPRDPSGQSGNVANPLTCTHDAGQLGTTRGVVGGVNRFDSFASKFRAMLASNTVPALNVLVLPNDHTNGTNPGAYSPKALIADNDLALGQFVEEISQSPIWKDSAIFVVEDDSQDGADHVDAHRMPSFMISPYANKGAVVHTHYDQYSVLRTIELILGLQPLSLNDALATPMFDAFTNGAPDVEGTRYTAVQPAQNLNEVNSSSSPDAQLSSRLPFNKLDLVPQALLDRILWHSVKGAGSRPPAPGPHASAREHARAVGALRVFRAGGDVRDYLNTHGEPGDEYEKKGHR